VRVALRCGKTSRSRRGRPMAEQAGDAQGLATRWRTQMDVTAMMAVLAFVVSGLSFYRSYVYVRQQLDVTVTEVSHVTNESALYLTVAFANGGNRDAALLRAEPALWSRRDNDQAPTWVPLAEQVYPAIPVSVPKTPMVIKAGGVEVVRLATRLEPSLAE